VTVDSSMRRGVAVAVAAALAAAVVAPVANAETVKLANTGGTSTIALSKSAQKRNKKAKVRVTASQKATASSSVVKLPIKGGAVDPVTFDGSASHYGKLTFGRGSRKLGLTEIVISKGKTSTASATLRGQRVGILSLDTSAAKYVRSGVDGGTLSNVRAKLSAKLAKALNKALRTKAYKKGQLVGTLTVSGKLAQALVAGGQSQLALSPAMTSALQSQGVTVAPIPPATINGPTITFPVIGGSTINLPDVTINAPGASLINLQGGITLTKGDTTVTIAAPVFDLSGNTLNVTTSVVNNVNNTITTGPITLPLANVTGTFAPVFTGNGSGNSFEISNVTNTLSAQATAVLDHVGIHIPVDTDVAITSFVGDLF
jgi:hypothetical protein